MFNLQFLFLTLMYFCSLISTSNTCWMTKLNKIFLQRNILFLYTFLYFFQSTQHSMFDTQNLSIHKKWVVQTLCANGNQSEHCLHWVLPNQNILLLAQMLDQSVENVKMVWSLTHEILSVFPNSEVQNTMSTSTLAINMSATDTSVMSAIMLDNTSQHQLLHLTRKLISNVRFCECLILRIFKMHCF